MALYWSGSLAALAHARAGWRTTVASGTRPGDLRVAGA
jgi:hypothetical protein